MAQLTDASAGPADERIAAYLQGKHHPQRALPPRVAWVATINAEVIGYVAGHLTRRFDCEGELQYIYVAPAYRRNVDTSWEATVNGLSNKIRSDLRQR
jgi:hypothetical protein